MLKIALLLYISAGVSQVENRENILSTNMTIAKIQGDILTPLSIRQMPGPWCLQAA